MNKLLAEAKAEKKLSKSKIPYIIVIFPLLMVYFDDKDFSTQKTYMVKWLQDDEDDEDSDENTFYSANIILLGSKYTYYLYFLLFLYVMEI